MLFAVLVNSLLMSLLFLAYHVVAKRTSVAVSLIFLVSLWLSFEKFHLNWDFSWPWLNLGNGLAGFRNGSSGTSTPVRLAARCGF
jgi:apolipoprotein N-acyltransferase